MTSVRFEFVVLSARITVGAEIEPTISNATNSSASKRSVQRACPAGGFATSDLQQTGLAFAIKHRRTRRPRSAFAFQGRIQALGDKALPDVVYSLLGTRKGRSRLRSRPFRAVSIGFQQDARVFDLIRRGVADAHDLGQPVAFVLRQPHMYLLFMSALPENLHQSVRSIS